MSEQQRADESLTTLPHNIAAHLQNLRTNLKAKNASKTEASEPPAAPLWETLSGRLREHIGEATFKRWFEPITATLSTERPYCLRLAFPTRFKRDWIEQNHGDLIRAFWRELEPEGTLHLTATPPPKSADEKPKKAQVINFPTIPTETRPIVNEIASSALFAAIQGKDRQFLINQVISASGDTIVKFTGEQFNQDDHDTFMQLVSLASHYPIGDYVPVTGHSLLKALGRGTSGKERAQLDAEIKRLKEANFEIKTRRFLYLGNLIHDALKDETTGHWTFRLNELSLIHI